MIYSVKAVRSDHARHAGRLPDAAPVDRLAQAALAAFDLLASRMVRASSWRRDEEHR